MKTVKAISNLEFKITIELTEAEARALDKFAYFGAYDKTTKFINEHWGNDIDYAALKKFFDTAHTEINPHLAKADEARKIFNK